MVLVVEPVQNSFLVENDVSLGFGYLCVVVFSCFCYQLIHEVIFLSVLGKLIGFGERKGHFSGNMQIFLLCLRQMPGGADSFHINSFDGQYRILGAMDVDSDSLELLQLLMKLPVAEQKPLRKLHYTVKTVHKVFELVYDLLVILHFRLLFNSLL